MTDDSESAPTPDIQIGGGQLSQKRYAEIAHLVGNFILHISIFDVIVSELVAVVHEIDPNPRNVGLVHHVPLQTKLEILKGISVKLQTGVVRDALRKLADKSERLIQKRNLAAHGLLDLEGEEVLYHSMTSTRKLKADQAKQVLYARDLPALTEAAEQLIELASSTCALIRSRQTPQQPG